MLPIPITDLLNIRYLDYSIVQHRMCVQVLLAHLGPFRLGSGHRTVLELVFHLNTCELEIITVPAFSGQWEQ